LIFLLSNGISTAEVEQEIDSREIGTTTTATDDRWNEGEFRYSYISFHSTVLAQIKVCSKLRKQVDAV